MGQLPRGCSCRRLELSSASAVLANAICAFVSPHAQLHRSTYSSTLVRVRKGTTWIVQRELERHTSLAFKNFNISQMISVDSLHACRSSYNFYMPDLKF